MAKSHRLAGGERIEVDLAPAAELPAEGPPLELAWRDEHLVVVRKPAGLPTHPTENRRGGTVVNRLLGMGIPLAPRGGPLRPGIVHRLDAGTSGLLVVACDDETYEALAAMFKRHEAGAPTSRSCAVVPHDRFEVDAPLGRAGARIRVDATGGREASTAFEVRERFDRATLLEAEPRTGRTHQIRVHLSSIGHPILGDRRYGGEGTTLASSVSGARSCTRGGSRSTTRSRASGSTWRTRCPRTCGRARSAGSVGLISAGRARPLGGTARAGYGPPRARRAERPRRRGTATATR